MAWSLPHYHKRKRSADLNIPGLYLPSQAVAMVRRECPGCTCGIESSLAVKHAAKHLTQGIAGRQLEG
jgi:hypothetical protein